MWVESTECICATCKVKQGCKARQIVIHCQSIMEKVGSDEVTVNCYIKECKRKVK